MEQFKKLISLMPVQEQAFTSKRKTWDKYYEAHKCVFDKVFINENELDVEISRNDLFKLAKEDDLKTFILSTILWGYSSGMRGNHFENIFNDMEELACHLDQIKRNNSVIDWAESDKFLRSIRGLGLSTYTKFLYFLSANINGYPALILDLRLIDVLSNERKNRLSFEENDLEEFKGLKKIRYDNATDKYPLYLKYMDTVAKKHSVKSDQLEMFLFEFGSNLKAVAVS